ncbi:hypothetical protein HYDPIDRAFT_167850 [Hydnomerulius pinastri MD-312]|uniref:Uncharacterized protein n=1 Tax=Hydnomerulius pinastri MD-312 TaxID=994086 RepID=A0A0C9WF78_9AGAM|nr:hypothetical protein HYDPIDRAFT_167850 [Hydnomerulius pinastri MD-312]
MGWAGLGWAGLGWVVQSFFHMGALGIETTNGRGREDGIKAPLANLDFWKSVTVDAIHAERRKIRAVKRERAIPDLSSYHVESVPLAPSRKGGRRGDQVPEQEESSPQSQTTPSPKRQAKLLEP